MGRMGGGGGNSQKRVGGLEKRLGLKIGQHGWGLKSGKTVGESCKRGWGKIETKKLGVSRK